MSEQIITKRCPKCKEIKALSEFHKNRSRKDGHHAYCKICFSEIMKKRRQTKEYKVYQRAHQIKHRKTKKGKAAMKRYSQSEKGKATGHRYEQSEKGKAASANNARLYKKRHPEKRRAHKAVRCAIKAGKLTPPKTLKCNCCPNQAQEYHHYKGYAREYWLDVIPVCKECHIEITWYNKVS